ncbi:MAG TPA: hypothetical protein VHB48_09245, partial [Chitinophagaceae bacterium]|nr:hypothetical protein [Chitinophagaceae bacterium]
MKKVIVCFLTIAVTVIIPARQLNAQLLRVGVAGLNHDHVNNIMNQNKNGEVVIIGIAEPDAQLAAKYKAKFQLPDSIFYASVPEML